MAVAVTLMSRAKIGLYREKQARHRERVTVLLPAAAPVRMRTVVVAMAAVVPAAAAAVHVAAVGLIPTAMVVMAAAVRVAAVVVPPAVVVRAAVVERAEPSLARWERTPAPDLQPRWQQPWPDDGGTHFQRWPLPL